MAAQITLFNRLGENLSLVPRYSDNSTLSEWKGYDFLCGGTDVGGYDISSMVGFALFSGHYSADNISQASTPPLQLAPSVGIPCATWPEPTKVVFLPNSDMGVFYLGDPQRGPPAQIMVKAATQSCSGSSIGGYCGEGKGLLGYWNTTAMLAFQNATTSSRFFQHFPLGEYTLAVQDVWNQTVYAYFNVATPASSPVEVVSVNGPISPYNPGGPVVSITLKNVGGLAITSLRATLWVESQLPNPYSFVFDDVSPSSPLLTGQSAKVTQTLMDGGFDSSRSYPLTISATLSDGTTFTYAQQVWIVPPG